MATAVRISRFIHIPHPRPICLFIKGFITNSIVLGNNRTSLLVLSDDGTSLIVPVGLFVSDERTLYLPYIAR